MKQVLHGSARTTAAVRAAVVRRLESLQTLAACHGINSKTSAPWHQPTTPEQRRIKPAKEAVHELSHCLSARRFCGSPDRRRPPIPFCGHRPHPQDGLRQTAPARQARGGRRVSAPRARQTVLPSAYSLDGQRGTVHPTSAPTPARWAQLRPHLPRLRRGAPPDQAGQPMDQRSRRAPDRTITEAPVQRNHSQTTDEPNEYRQAFLLTYDHARRLKKLRGLAPHEFVCAQ